MKYKNVFFLFLMISNFSHAVIGKIVGELLVDPVSRIGADIGGSYAQEKHGYDSDCKEMKDIRKFAISAVMDGKTSIENLDVANMNLDKCKKNINKNASKNKELDSKAINNNQTNTNKWQKISGFPIAKFHDNAKYIPFNGEIFVLGGYFYGGKKYYNTVSHSKDGIIWNRYNAPWSKRYNLSTVVFNNKLWVIGGRTGYTKYYRHDSNRIKGYRSWVENDIWSSSDGIKWHKVIDTPFSPRVGNITVAFNNKIWVIGGYFQDNNNVTQKINTDVWSSSDGNNWEEVVNLPWLPQQIKGVVFDNKIWIISLGENSKIWNSSDGINWNKVSNMSPLWDISNILVFKNKILVSGYDKSSVDDRNDSPHYIWHSANGIKWDQLTDNAMTIDRSSRYKPYDMDLIFNNKIWSITKPILSSSDGFNWFKLKCQTWLPKNDTSICGLTKIASSYDKNRYKAYADGVIFRDKIWLIGGSGNGNYDENYVWSSTDGISWVKETKIPYMHGYNVAVFKDRIWIISGSDHGRENKYILSSKDGIIWKKDKAPSWTYYSDALITFNNKIWVIDGGTIDVYGDIEANNIWSSKDGVNWTKSKIKPNGLKSKMLSYIFGNPGYSAWSSEDFITEIFNNRIWVIGNKDTWSSVDGSTWKEHKNTEQKGLFTKITKGLSSVIYNNKLWIIIDNKAVSGKLNNNGDIEWKYEAKLPALNEEKSFFLPIVFQDKLIAIGGDSVKNKDDVFFYDDIRKEWVKKSQVVNKVNRSKKIKTYDIEISGYGYGRTLGEHTNKVKVKKHCTTFTPRAYATSVVFKNRIWIFDGKTIDNNRNAIYSSSDGKCWHRESDSPAFSSYDSREFTSGSQLGDNIVVFKDKIYIVSSSRRGKYWSSNDGITWEAGIISWTNNDGVPSYRSRDVTTLVFQNKLWVIDIDRGKEVLSSADGENFQKISDFPRGNGGIYNLNSLVFNNKMWLLIKRGKSCEINISSDGKDWQKIANSPACESSTVFNNKIWVFGKNSIYISQDGKKWNKVKNIPWTNRRGISNVVYKNKLWIIGGRNYKFKNDVWALSK